MSTKIKDASVASQIGRVSPAGSKTPESITGCRSPGASSIGEDSCPICLGSFTDKCAAGSCFHFFCFVCLKEWAKQKSVCPLCKQSFTKILYDIKSEDNYKEWKVPLPKPPDSYHHYLYSNSQIHQNDYAHVIPSAERRRERRRIHFDRGSSLFRLSVYTNNIWIQPISDITGRYRESSPQIYREQPALTHRLVPWLNRELAALIPISHIASVLVEIMNLIEEVPIMSAHFVRALHSHFGSRARHFAHEFYNFARSPYDIIGHDNAAQYVPRYENDIPEFQSSDEHEVILLDSDNDVDVVESSDAAIFERDPNVTDTYNGLSCDAEIIPGSNGSAENRVGSLLSNVYSSSVYRTINFSDSTEITCEIRSTPVQGGSLNDPQPGPSGINSSRINAVKNDDSSSDSECCFVVDIIKPKHERTPEVIDILSSECEDMNRKIKSEYRSSKTRLKEKSKKPRLDRNSFSLNYSRHLSEDQNYSPECIPSTSTNHTINLTLHEYCRNGKHSHLKHKKYRNRLCSSSERDRISTSPSSCKEFKILKRSKRVILSSSSSSSTDNEKPTTYHAPSKAKKGDKSKIKNSSKNVSATKSHRSQNSKKEKHKSKRSHHSRLIVEQDNSASEERQRYKNTHKEGTTRYQSRRSVRKHRHSRYERKSSSHPRLPTGKHNHSRVNSNEEKCDKRHSKSKSTYTYWEETTDESSSETRTQIRAARELSSSSSSSSSEYYTPYYKGIDRKRRKKTHHKHKSKSKKSY